MLNVSEVFTSKWLQLDKVRDYVESAMRGMKDSGGQSVFTDGQIALVKDALDVSKTRVLVPSSPLMDFQTNNGVVIPDTPSCVEIATAMYRDSLGNDIDTTPETHVGRMIEQTGKILASVLGITAANIMQHDLNSATGAYLDAIASWFYLERKNGARTSREITLVCNDTSASSFVLTPENAYFTDGDGLKFSLSGEVVFSAANNWRVDLVPFVAPKPGQVKINDNGLVYSSTISEKFTVSTIGATRVGYDIESDDLFRNRIKETRARSVAFMESVYSAIYAISGVYDAYLGENVKASQTEVKGLPLDGHSIVAVVSYDGTSSTKTAIAKALYENKSVGCGYTDLQEVYERLSPGEKELFPYLDRVRSETIPYKDPWFETEYPIIINHPASVEFGLKIEVSRYHYAGNDLAAEIREALRAWANGDIPYQEGLKVGQGVKAYEIGAALSAKIPDIQIDDVEIIKYTGDEDTEVTAEQAGGYVWGAPFTTKTESGTYDADEEESRIVSKIELPSYAVGVINQNDIRIKIS